MSEELSPCPFCRGVSMRIDETTHWTGMRPELLFVTLTHWCGDRAHVGGNHPGSKIEIRRKTRAEVIAAWNTRAPANPKD